jgi:hypothetical protein
VALANGRRSFFPSFLLSFLLAPQSRPAARGGGGFGAASVYFGSSRTGTPVSVYEVRQRCTTPCDTWDCVRHVRLFTNGIYRGVCDDAPRRSHLQGEDEAGAHVVLHDHVLGGERSHLPITHYAVHVHVRTAVNGSRTCPVGAAVSASVLRASCCTHSILTSYFAGSSFASGVGMGGGGRDARGGGEWALVRTSAA